jgi:hypothetical protein
MPVLSQFLGGPPPAGVSRASCPTAAGHAILAQSMYAFTTSVPEIDPAGASSVVALVVGCLSLIERRRTVGGITGSSVGDGRHAS